jgi:hypothetical protein
MDIEREFEDRLEMAAHKLAISNAMGEQVPAENITGDWDIYGPDYLDLREVTLRESWKEGKRFDFRHYKNGTLRIMELSDDALVSTMDATGALWLDGFEYDWHIPINVHQVASTEVRAYQAIKRKKIGRDSGNSEVGVGFYFLGNGYLKLKIPSISLRNQEEWGRYTTLYGINRSIHPRDQDATYQRLQRLPQGEPGHEFMRISRHTPEATPGPSTARQAMQERAGGPSNAIYIHEDTPGATPGPSTEVQSPEYRLFGT